MDSQDVEDTLEVPPAPVASGRRPWRSVLAVMAIGLSTFVVAALAGGTPVAQPPSAIARVSRDIDPAPQTASPTATRSIPIAMTCHEIDRSTCRLAVATALGTLGADVPAVVSVDVWSDLLCGDTLDCPATRLDGRTTPLGSVIVGLAGGGPAAWINVVYRSHGRPLDFDPTLEAWIARWQASP